MSDYPLKEIPVSHPTVYQVRSVDAYGHQRIVHAYETSEQAQNAIDMMVKSNKRIHRHYIISPVTNHPACHWAVHFPPKPIAAPKTVSKYKK